MIRMITAMSDDNTAIHCIIGCNDTIIMIMLILFIMVLIASLCSHTITMIA